MKTGWLKWMVAVAIVGLAGCSYTKFSGARADYDPEAPLEEYLTFSWLPDSVTYADDLSQSTQKDAYDRKTKKGKDPFTDNRLVKKRIRKAIEAEVLEQGYERAAADRADFWVNYLVVRDQKEGLAHRGRRGRFYFRGSYVRYYPSHGHFYYPHRHHFGPRRYPFYRGYPWWYWYGDVRYYRYQDGTLIIDIIEPSTRSLVWRGWYSGVVNFDNTIDDKTIRRAAREILKAFPPRM